jgi:hypothetical protein
VRTAHAAKLKLFKSNYCKPTLKEPKKKTEMNKKKYKSNFCIQNLKDKDT